MRRTGRRSRLLPGRADSVQTLFKHIVPTGLLRVLRARRLAANRRAIMASAARHGRVVLVPDNLAEHYYHFLFDLALPLHLLLQQAPADAHFAVRSSGPFLPRLETLFGSRVSLASGKGDLPHAKRQVLLGMNPLFVNVARGDLEGFAQHARSMLHIGGAAARNAVLLIERCPPGRYFTHEAVKPGAGASRRHIPNHEALEAALRAALAPGYELRNVRLESMSFEEQTDAFTQAAVVIGQHGAGLANCIWMGVGSVVVELSHNPKMSHFEVLSRTMQQHHILHHMQGAHAEVDIAELIAQLRRDTRMRAVLS